MFSAEDLTVIIPTRDRWPILRRTLDALARQTVQGFDVVVVVDGDDQQVAELRKEEPPVRLIVREHAGPGAARNAGVRHTDRRLILFLGDDMVPEPQVIERHLAAHARSPEDTTAVLGHVDWAPQLQNDRIASWLDWSSTQFDYRNISGPDAGWGRFYSCNVSLKREFFVRVGGFDEDFVFYYEDLDAARRLHENGMRLLYEPAARVRHDHRYDLEGIRRRFEGVAVGEHMMAQKHEWFEPFFLARVRHALSRPRASSIWPRIVDHVPRSIRPVRSRVEARANDWYYQQVAPRFMSAWEGARDLDDLRAYLGDRFDIELLRSAPDAVEREHDAAPDEHTFYQTSEMYLYDLTAFAMSGTKVPYLADLRKAVPSGSLLDWGCGIGSDGLRLLDRGYRVAFVDFDSPSTRYLRWRLERRGLDAPIYDLESDEIPGGFDAAYSFDVIEHVDDPFAFLDEMERRARIVAVNLLEPVENDTHLHKPLPIKELLDHARERGVVSYRLYHGRSHLVIYRSR